MKRHHLNLIFATGLLITSSCTTTKPLISGVKANEINDLLHIESFSYISLIESGNKSKYNDTISMKAKDLLTKVTNKLRGQIPITDDIVVPDTAIKRKLEKEIGFLCLSADRQKSISNLKITPLIDSLLELNEKRFGLITVSSGFTRANGNYAGQIAKGVGIGILTLGMYYQTPVKSNSTIYAMIVDAKENNVAFFKKTSLQDKEPLDEDVLTMQLKKIFDGYFYAK